MFHIPKQAVPSINLHMTHRKQFSTPAAAVVVQSTKTPGLLSLSKPPRTVLQQRSLNQQQQPQPRQARTSKPKQQAITASRSSSTATTAITTPLANSAIANALAVAKNVVSEVKEAQTQVPSPEKQPRGRSHRKTLKEKTPRRVSPNPSPRPQPRRQPSPPTEIDNSSLSDPFIASDSDSDSKAKMTPFMMHLTPTIASRPNGNLATRRRQQQPSSPSPTPAKPLPVPGATLSTGARPTLARSDPVPSHMPARPAPRRSQTAMRREFPLLEESRAIRTQPVTPTRNRAWPKSTELGDYPRTAPLSGFPFSGSLSNQRRHARTPSEGVFNLPFDEDADVFTNPSDMQALINMLNRTPARGTSFDAAALARENREKEAARLFANSQFQNSPSPDELPPPCF